jgi:hypothetical protein
MAHVLTPTWIRSLRKGSGAPGEDYLIVDDEERRIPAKDGGGASRRDHLHPHPKRGYGVS